MKNDFLMKSSNLSIVLAAAIVILGYFVFTSIKAPLRFREELQRRNNVIMTKLADIRTAEILYKQINNRYTGDFDTLADFIKKAKIPVVRILASPKDTSMSNPVNYSICYMNISDSIFGKRNNNKLKDMAIIPFSSGAKFMLAAGRISKDGVLCPVFEASAPFRIYLKGIDDKFLSQMVEETNRENKFPGLKVGSLKETLTTGNWE